MNPLESLAQSFAEKGVSLADHKIVQAAVNKWKLSDEPDRFRACITALILENQEKHFAWALEAGWVPDNITELYGENWEQDVYDGIIHAWRKTILPDICAIQPATGPLLTLAYYNPRIQDMVEATSIDGDGNETKVLIPEVRLDISLRDIQVESRKSKVRFNSPSILDRMIENKTLMRDAFKETLTEVTREVLGTMLYAVDGTARVMESEDDLASILRTISSASQTVHRETQRAPANNLLVGHDVLSKLSPALKDRVEVAEDGPQKVGMLNGKTVYFDHVFPKGQILLWYQSFSILDTGFIYTPYSYEFTEMNSEKTQYAGKVRHKITAVRPEFAHLIKLKEPEA